MEEQKDQPTLQESFSIEGKAAEPEAPKLMDIGIVAERVRRLLKLAPGTRPTLEQLSQVPADQLWKVEEARLLARARGESEAKPGKGPNRAQRRA